MDYLALVLLFSFGGALAKSEAELELSSTQLREGDDLIITCKITEKGKFDIGRIYRRIDGSDDGGKAEEIEISSNNGIASALADLGRYEVIEYVPGSNAIMKVKISGITGSDAGTIGCKKLNEGEAAEEKITVKVPPKSVTLQYISSDPKEEPVVVEDGGIITLQKGIENGIRCKVFTDGTGVKPKTSITVGKDDDIKDITKRFQHSAKKTKLVWTSGLLNLTRNDTYTWKTKDFNVAEAGKKITCSSEMNDFPVVTTSATMHIHFKPEWTKCDDTWKVKPGSTDVKIICRARMYPAGTNSAWSIGKKPNKTVLINEDNDDSQTFTTEVKDLGGNLFEYILKIAEISDEHFGKKYKIEVTNELGTIERKINIAEESLTTTLATTTLTDEEGIAENNGDGTHSEAIPIGKGSHLTMPASLVCLFAAFLIYIHH